MAGFQNKDSKGGFQPPLLGGFQQPGLSDALGGFQPDAAGQWTPKNIAGLVDWHRSDMGVTLVGSKVSAWADQSGLAHDLSQGTDANRPELISSAINGFPVLRFGFDLLLSWVPWVRGQDWTAFSVVKFVSAPTDYQILLTGSSPPSAYLGGNANHDKPMIFYAAEQAVWPAVLSAGTAYLVKHSVASSSPINFYTQVNGGAEVNSTHTDAFATSNWVSLGINVPGAQSLRSDIAEIIVYNRRLLAAEEAQVRSYVSGRYKIVM